MVSRSETHAAPRSVSTPKAMPLCAATSDEAASAVDSGRAPKYQTSPDRCAIHVIAPEATFVHVHKMALESGLRFSHYLNRFLNEAFPYSPEPRVEWPALSPRPAYNHPAPPHRSQPCEEHE